MLTRLVPLAVLTLFVPGCEPSGTGDVTVRWSVGLTGSCSTARLLRMRAFVETREGYEVMERGELCSEGSVRFEDVPVGTYRVRVVGEDEEGVEAYGAIVEGVDVTEVPESEPVLVRLAPLPGDMRVTWFFQGGRLCSSYGVERIGVRLFADDEEVADAEVPCDEAEVRFEKLRPDMYGIRVEGLDRSGEVTHTFTVGGVAVRPGHDVELEATLSPCTTDCG